MNALALSSDPVLSLLDKRNVSENEILAICEPHSEIKPKDVLAAFHIWLSLNAYLQEIESDWFSLLAEYEIDTALDVDDFHLDLAIKVGARSQELLDEIYIWDIQDLKRKVHRNRNSVISSDATSLLTILVLRIISKFSRLEFKLHLSLSKSILTKINYELTGLLARFGNKSTDKSKGFMAMFGLSSTQKPIITEDNPLLMKYRSFIKQLLREMELTPFESVQQEMFQVVHDLRQMFLSFSNAAQNEASSSAWTEHEYTPEKDFSHIRNISGSTSSERTTLIGEPHHKPSGTIVDELPSIMAAFKDAERKQISTPQPIKMQNATETSISKKSAVKKDSMKLPMIHETKNFSKFQRPAMALTPSASASTPAITSASASTPVSSTASNLPSSQSLNVKMINNRMMVNTPSGFVDMQQWLNRQNNQTIVISDRSKLPVSQVKSPASPMKTPTNQMKMSSTLTALNYNTLNAKSSTKPAVSNSKSWKTLFTRVEKDFESSYASSMDF